MVRPNTARTKPAARARPRAPVSQQKRRTHAVAAAKPSALTALKATPHQRFQNYDNDSVPTSEEAIALFGKPHCIRRKVRENLQKTDDALVESVPEVLRPVYKSALKSIDDNFARQAEYLDADQLDLGKIHTKTSLALDFADKYLIVPGAARLDTIGQRDVGKAVYESLATAWKNAKQQSDKDVLNKFIDDYSEARFADTARAPLDQVSDHDVVQMAAPALLKLRLKDAISKGLEYNPDLELAAERDVALALHTELTQTTDYDVTCQAQLKLLGFDKVLEGHDMKTLLQTHPLDTAVAIQKIRNALDNHGKIFQTTLNQQDIDAINKHDDIYLRPALGFSAERLYDDKQQPLYNMSVKGGFTKFLDSENDIDVTKFHATALPIKQGNKTLFKIKRIIEGQEVVVPLSATQYRALQDDPDYEVAPIDGSSDQFDKTIDAKKDVELLGQDGDLSYDHAKELLYGVPGGTVVDARARQLYRLKVKKLKYVDPFVEEPGKDFTGLYRKIEISPGQEQKIPVHRDEFEAWVQHNLPGRSVDEVLDEFLFFQDVSFAKKSDSLDAYGRVMRTTGGLPLPLFVRSLEIQRIFRRFNSEYELALLKKSDPIEFYRLKDKVDEFKRDVEAHHASLAVDQPQSIHTVEFSDKFPETSKFLQFPLWHDSYEDPNRKQYYVKVPEPSEHQHIPNPSGLYHSSEHFDMTVIGKTQPTVDNLFRKHNRRAFVRAVIGYGTILATFFGVELFFWGGIRSPLDMVYGEFYDLRLREQYFGVQFGRSFNEVMEMPVEEVIEGLSQRPLLTDYWTRTTDAATALQEMRSHKTPDSSNQV